MAKDKTDSPASFRIRQRDQRATVQKSYWIPQDIATELKVQAAREHRDASDIVSSVLADYLNQAQDRKGGKKLLP